MTIYEVLKYMQFDFNAMKDGMTRQQWKEFMSFIRNYGWVDDDTIGDGIVDLGVYRGINEAAIAGRSDVIFIEFNYDGNLEEIESMVF